MALGLSRKAVYAEGTLTLAPGDVLMAYSDGITEAESPAGAAFDEEGLRVLADEMDGLLAGVIARRVIDRVKTHTDDTTLFDDLTVLVVRHRTLADPPPLPS